jgi:peptide chain release factor 2
MAEERKPGPLGTTPASGGVSGFDEADQTTGGSTQPGPLGVDVDADPLADRFVTRVDCDWVPTPKPKTDPIEVTASNLADLAALLAKLPEAGEGGGRLRADDVKPGTSAEATVSLHGNLVNRAVKWIGYDNASGGIFDFDAKASEKLIEVSKQLEDPAIWNDAARAQDLGKEKKTLEGVVVNLQRNRPGPARLQASCSRSRAGRRRRHAAAVEADAAGPRKPVANSSSAACSTTRWTRNNCFIDIQAGAGGTEAQDWAGMLLRMYLRYCERKGFKVEVLEESEGEVAGIKSATLKIERRIRLRLPAHRDRRPPPGAQVAVRLQRAPPHLVRRVFVYPEVDDSIEIEINPADLRIDTYRASGAGGQHINKTDSAVRITHVPTGIVVQCQNDRSQHRNKAEAMAMLKRPLYEAELRKRQASSRSWRTPRATSAGATRSAPTCSTSRASRTCAPTYEVGNTQAVLDGDLDGFIEASLKQGV